MSLQNLFTGLDEEQKKAVTLKTNGVAAAGAGSGKTKVLASRYVWLVAEENLKPEEILTLTFTNKAVSEMYNRIYRYLLEESARDSAAGNTAEALKNFHKARINTLDSFSAGIARTAAPRYGISPDFKSDDTALRDLAREAALGFVLNHREAPAIRQLLVDNKIRDIAGEIFTRVVLEYSPVSSPLKFNENLVIQKKVILEAWKEKVHAAEEITDKIIEALTVLAEINKSIKLTQSLGEILLKTPPPPLPDIEPLLETSGADEDAGRDETLPQSAARQQIKKYFDYYSTLIAIRLPSNYGEVFTPVVEYSRMLKGRDGDGLYQELESIANYACNFGLCAGIFALMEKFQNEFNKKKRESGFLSFNDIARLAVDALKEHPDIRKAYKDPLKMIMIDEFQDNNALQRDLIFLLAENPDRIAAGIAGAGELEKNRMFFVGDEKQSIYRFRGADVAVFRSLGRTLFPSDLHEGQGSGIIELVHNYRSQPGLIAVFNRIFGGPGESAAEGKGVFLPPGPDVPDYEARYSRIWPPGTDGKNIGRGDSSPRGCFPLAHFCFLNSDDLPQNTTEGIRSQDLEAVFIAGKIRDMVEAKEMIPKRTGGEIIWKPCGYGDFAVLERSYTHQSTLEKYFREFGVPYNTDRPSGLFNDAPILDMRAFLRLLVYPEDRIAYAALLRSPFMRLSDLSLTVCMLSKNQEPFTEENETLIPEEERELYRRARERYRSLREASRTLPVTELVTKLWFEEGYRYETLWTESAQVYESLFDLFFNLACETDSRGKSLADFIEYLDDVMNREIKPDAKDIPGEGESGVKIMSIHKSKGLEFPIVFIFDSSHSGNNNASRGLISFHEKYGVILNIPQAEELPLGGNYFRTMLSEEEKAKDTAELRRLLYVAMTRAESRLFMTFTLPRQTKDECKEWDIKEMEFTKEVIKKRLIQLHEKTNKKDSPENQGTFLKLLEGILPDCPDSLCGLETIPVLSRAEISKLSGHTQKSGIRSQRKAALDAEDFYEHAEILPEGKAGPPDLDASRLRYKDSFISPGATTDAISDIDILLGKAGVSPADFGSLVHSVLEGRLSQRPGLIPPKIRSRLADEDKTYTQLIAAAEAMADAFLSSELGKRCAAAEHRESEFPIITSVTIEGKAIAIRGQIDLLFGENGKVVVVDFKTGKIENSEDHLGQLAAYYRAAGDIFGKPVSVWLHYLRSGRSENVTDKVQIIPLEEIAAESLENSTNNGKVTAKNMHIM